MRIRNGNIVCQQTRTEVKADFGDGFYTELEVALQHSESCLRVSIKL